MSFAAVVALIAAWEAAAGWRRRLHERAERARHRWLWRLAAAIAASLATTLIASIATGAFAAYHFNRLSLLGVVANLLGVPLTGFWIMPWGLAGDAADAARAGALRAWCRWAGASKA